MLGPQAQTCRPWMTGNCNVGNGRCKFLHTLSDEGRLLLKKTLEDNGIDDNTCDHLIGVFVHAIHLYPCTTASGLRRHSRSSKHVPTDLRSSNTHVPDLELMFWAYYLSSLDDQHHIPEQSLPHTVNLMCSAVHQNFHPQPSYIDHRRLQTMCKISEYFDGGCEPSSLYMPGVNSKKTYRNLLIIKGPSVRQLLTTQWQLPLLSSSTAELWMQKLDVPLRHSITFFAGMAYLAASDNRQAAYSNAFNCARHAQRIFTLKCGAGEPIPTEGYISSINVLAEKLGSVDNTTLQRWICCFYTNIQPDSKGLRDARRRRSQTLESSNRQISRQETSEFDTLQAAQDVPALTSTEARAFDSYVRTSLQRFFDGAESEAGSL